MNKIYPTRVYTAFQTRMLLNGNIRKYLLKITEDFFLQNKFIPLYI